MKNMAWLVFLQTLISFPLFFALGFMASIALIFVVGGIGGNESGQLLNSIVWGALVAYIAGLSSAQVYKRAYRTTDRMDPYYIAVSVVVSLVIYALATAACLFILSTMSESQLQNNKGGGDTTLKQVILWAPVVVTLLLQGVAFWGIFSKRIERDKFALR